MEVVREPKKSMDSILLFLVLLLVVWGLIFLYRQVHIMAG